MPSQLHHANYRTSLDPAGHPFVAAGAGGVQAHVGRECEGPDDNDLAMPACHEYRCTEYLRLNANAHDIFERYARGPVHSRMLACADQKIDNVVVNDVLPWAVIIDGLQQGLDFSAPQATNASETAPHVPQDSGPGSAMPHDGIWPAGGIRPPIRDFSIRNTFTERFPDKGRMRVLRESIRVRLMEYRQPGVIGAAGWTLEQDHSTSHAPNTASTSSRVHRRP